MICDGDIEWARKFIRDFLCDNFISLGEAKETRFYAEAG